MLSHGAITSIVLTPDSPTTLSNGRAYYLAGQTYTFDVQVIDPAATNWTDVGSVYLTIPSGNPVGSSDIVVYVDNFAAGPAYDENVSSGNVSLSTSIPGTDTPDDFTVTFNILIQWNTPETVWASNTVTAQATVTNTDNITQTYPYGVSSTMRVLNFDQDGDANDGKVNPWHTGFNVTGDLVYDVPGATVADAVNVGELGNLDLVHSGTATTVTILAANPFSFTVPAEWMNAQGFVNISGAHTWTVQAATTDPGGPVTSSNTLAITCDRVEIVSIEIINGGGVGVASPWHRSVNTPGTQLRVTARMEDSTGVMEGDTTIRISDNAGTPNTYDVLISNGNTVGIANLVSYPAVPGDIPDNDTTALTYQAIRVFGGAYDGDTAAAEGQDAPGDITQTPIQVYWDSNDPPGLAPNNVFLNEAAFTANTTATTIDFTWDATPLSGNEDADFYSFRIYYRLSSDPDPPVFQVIDRFTPGYGSLANRATASASITGLVQYREYDYYITAVDVYGQEVFVDSGTNYTNGPHDALYVGAPGTNPIGRYYGTISTLPSSITVSISDGIDKYEDSHFTSNPGAASRPLRQANIKVDVSIITTQQLPDNVNLIIGDDTGPDLIDNPSASINPALTLDTDYFRISCLQSAPNRYTGYIPTSNPLIENMNDIKFVIETVKGGIYTYSDHDSDYDPAEQNPAGYDANDYPYRFAITEQPNFKPWPVRILNNVITDKNPVCYPSYYLTDDAFVTITAYDIKGRPVATIIDNAFRRGGQNIKDQGWRGVNKAQRKLGVGLYYIHIKAERASDGKVILNKFKKVVVAR